MPDDPEANEHTTSTAEAQHTQPRRTASPLPPLPTGAPAPVAKTELETISDSVPESAPKPAPEPVPEPVSPVEHEITRVQDERSPTVAPERWVQQDAEWDTSLHAVFVGYSREPNPTRRLGPPPGPSAPSRAKSMFLLGAVIVLILACVIGGFQLAHYGQIAIHSLQNTPTVPATQTAAPTKTTTAKKTAVPHR